MVLSISNISFLQLRTFSFVFGNHRFIVDKDRFWKSTRGAWTIIYVYKIEITYVGSFHSVSCDEPCWSYVRLRLYERDLGRKLRHHCIAMQQLLPSSGWRSLLVSQITSWTHVCFFLFSSVRLSPFAAACCNGLSSRLTSRLFRGNSVERMLDRVRIIFLFSGSRPEFHFFAVSLVFSIFMSSWWRLTTSIWNGVSIYNKIEYFTIFQKNDKLMSN